MLKIGKICLKTKEKENYNITIVEEIKGSSKFHYLMLKSRVSWLNEKKINLLFMYWIVAMRMLNQEKGLQ